MEIKTVLRLGRRVTLRELTPGNWQVVGTGETYEALMPLEGRFSLGPYTFAQGKALGPHHVIATYTGRKPA